MAGVWQDGAITEVQMDGANREQSVQGRRAVPPVRATTQTGPHNHTVLWGTRKDISKPCSAMSSALQLSLPKKHSQLL